MSRSYKKAIHKYAPVRGKPGKQFANRKVRIAKDVPDGMGYKKIFCSYEIHDWISDLRFGNGEWLPPGSVWNRQSGWRMPK